MYNVHSMQPLQIRQGLEVFIVVTANICISTTIPSPKTCIFKRNGTSYCLGRYSPLSQTDEDLPFFHTTTCDGAHWVTQDWWAVNDTASVQTVQWYQTQLLLSRRVRHLNNEAMVTIVRSHYLVFVGINQHAGINPPDFSANSSELATCYGFLMSQQPSSFPLQDTAIWS